MTSVLFRLTNWWNGWRTDEDGWLFRSARPGDPPAGTYLDPIGFVDDDGSVVVANHGQARTVDQLSRGNARGGK